MVHSISIDPEVIRRQKDLSIVYTPLHGAGRVLIPDSLKEWGFENIGNQYGNLYRFITGRPSGGADCYALRFHKFRVVVLSIP